jgi:pyrroline-5-carboxylate reductase
MKATVFLGGGRITGALLAGLRHAGYQGSILVHDRNPHKLRALQREHRIEIEPELQRAVEQANFLIIAVRPDSVAEVLTDVRRALASVGAENRNTRKPLTACSLAAGIPLSRLRSKLGPPVRWARAMPSPVARTGRGLTAVTFERGFPQARRKLVKQFFAHVGPVLEIPERKFDAFMVTFSPSHGYHALAALAKAAQKLGLDRRTAFAAATHALADGVVSWREASESLDALLHEAATPGGIAAKVMNTMNGAGHARMVERGLRAGIARARKNAKL